MTAPSGHDREAAGARPVNQIAGQCWLIAIGHGVNNTCFISFGSQPWAAECVRFNCNVDHMFAVAKGFQDMLDRSQRCAGAFDYNVDAWVLHKSVPIITNMSCAAARGFIQRRRAELIG